MNWITILLHWNDISPKIKPTVINAIRLGMYIGGIITAIIATLVHWYLSTL